jgi:organic hydroperoxide reductase OsmC/OhrA
MTENTTGAKPKIKYRSYEYETGLTWAGGKAGILSSDEKPEFRVASPPEFRGEAGVWTPEDLFVAAVEACSMTTFLSIVQKRKLPVTAYRSSATGTLEFKDGGFRMTRVVVRPEITISQQDVIAETELAVHDAHTQCLIARSVTSIVDVEPTILVEKSST